MIRDPSDGTVREARRRRETLKTKDEMHEMPVLGADASGLPIDKPDAKRIAQLEKSRDWLRNYFNRTSEQTKTGLRSPDHGEG